MNLFKNFWPAQLSFYHSDNAIILTHRSDHRDVILSDLCKHLTSPYRPSFMLFNGHLQTIWAALRRTDIVVHYKRRIFTSEHDHYPGTFAVDFADRDEDDAKLIDSSLPPHTTYFREHDACTGSLDSSPMLVVLHGVGGSSHEPYVKQVLAPLLASGWEAYVLVSRGCGGSQLTSPLLYNARSTWDLKQTVAFLRRKFPNRPLYAVGFSIGANILVNYLGEEGEQCGIRAAVACSNPWNLEVVDNALRRSWMGLYIYSHAMAIGMKQIVQRHAAMILRNHRIAAAAIHKIRFFFDFDRAVQLPMWGYPTRGTYYRDASSVDAVLAVKVPLFALNAEDDPIVHQEALPLEEFQNNPYTVLCTTSSGGHLGWYEAEGQRWFAKPIVSFLETLQHDIHWTQDIRPALHLQQTPQSFEHSPVRRRIQSIATSTFAGQADLSTTDWRNRLFITDGLTF